jgi:hypothetical protein
LNLEISGSGQTGDAVVVLGPHRSGTSALTKILNLLGVHLGERGRLVGPVRRDNDKGFFENVRIMSVNDALLQAWGGEWHDPPVLAEGWHHDARVEELRSRAREILAEDFAGAELWGFKDPRSCLTLPFWRELIGSAAYVICHRNALEVARSLEERNGIPIGLGLELWGHHMASAILSTAGERRILLGYDELFVERRSVIEELARFVGRERAVEDPRLLEQIDGWLEPGLRHHWARDDRSLPTRHATPELLRLHALVSLALRERSTDASLRGEASDGPLSAALEQSAAAFEAVWLARARRRQECPAVSRALRRTMAKARRRTTRTRRRLLAAAEQLR